ncbi:hypothetical protein [Candidatus Pyrohabitans sp.]
MVDVYTSLKILYILLGLSMVLNIVLALLVRSLRLQIRRTNTGITLSEDEIQQITSRLKRLSELHSDVEVPPINPKR